MIWPEPTGVHLVMKAACLIVLTALLLVATDRAPAQERAQEQPRDQQAPQAWLLTYGPGEVYWQRFGHNAIWIRDPAADLDHTFNFGFFDFAQRGFLRNFLLGRLNYFAAARPAQVELAEYIDADRSIRAQRLDLQPDQLAQLTSHLLNEISEAHREYLYDYFRHNCSTRVRDAIDLALGGGVRSRLTTETAALDFRQHQRRLTGMDYWLYLGLEAGLGSPVDRPISRWDETFIPGVLAAAVEGLANPGTGRPLIVEDVMLHQSSLRPPPETPQAHWLRYLVLSAGLLLAAFLAARFVDRITSGGLALAWLGIAGVHGVVLGFLWCCTDHWATTGNLNLLLLNPLWLLVALIPALRRPGAWLIIACGVVALAAPWLPLGQYNTDIVALVLPLNVAAALSLLPRTSDPDLGE